jgi:hypothetical protein
MKETIREAPTTPAPGRRMLTALFLAVFGVSALCALPFTPAAAQSASPEDCPEECRRQLAEARAATAKYHDVNAALADGFIPTGPCVAVPSLGAMGIHYANFFRLFDASVNPAEPEFLLYAPDGRGGLRLVALEYFVPAYLAEEPPALFGREFEGPMPGHGPGEPVHYDLHVWAWRHNPAGMFAPFNPKVGCGQTGGGNNLGGGGEGGFPGF